MGIQQRRRVVKARQSRQDNRGRAIKAGKSRRGVLSLHPSLRRIKIAGSGEMPAVSIQFVAFALRCCALLHDATQKSGLGNPVHGILLI